MQVIYYPTVQKEEEEEEDETSSGSGRNLTHEQIALLRTLLQQPRRRQQ